MFVLLAANEKKFAQLAGFLCVGNKCVGKNQPIVANFMLAVFFFLFIFQFYNSFSLNLIKVELLSNMKDMATKQADYENN
jgi:hypothetical protein